LPSVKATTFRCTASQELSSSLFEDFRLTCKDAIRNEFGKEEDRARERMTKSVLIDFYLIS